MLVGEGRSSERGRVSVRSFHYRILVSTEWRSERSRPMLNQVISAGFQPKVRTPAKPLVIPIRHGDHPLFAAEEHEQIQFLSTGRRCRWRLSRACHLGRGCVQRLGHTGSGRPRSWARFASRWHPKRQVIPGGRTSDPRAPSTGATVGVAIAVVASSVLSVFNGDIAKMIARLARAHRRVRTRLHIRAMDAGIFAPSAYDRPSKTEW